MDALSRLTAAHTLLFRGTPPRVPSDLPEGWYALVDELCSGIESILGPQRCAGLEVEQIKEKFAGLRFHVVPAGAEDTFMDLHDPDDVQTLVKLAEPSPPEMGAIRGLIAQASKATCQALRCAGPARRVQGAAKLESAVKLLVLSDIHLELGTSLTLPQNLEYDVVVLAGDIHSPGRKAVHWAQRESTFGGRPVFLVPGNHEFYGREMLAELTEMRKAAEGSNVHVLDRDELVVEGVRFLGCMLWTDFQLPIREDDGSMVVDVSRALEAANRHMNDFRLIELEAPMKSHTRGRQLRRLLRAEDTLAMHWVDRDWLRRTLAESFDGPSVVVTHHAPASGSVAERYAADWLTPAFVSDLPDALFEVPALWVHGHTHAPFDYRRGACRVVSNPRGYRRRDSSFENPRFDAGFIVEVSADPRVAPIERRALLDPDVRCGFEHYDSARLQSHGDPSWLHISSAGAEKSAEADPTRHADELAARADMVDLAQAAALAGATPEQLHRWATMKPPRVIALRHSTLGWRYPRWQFEAAAWPVIQRLAGALQGDCWAMLAWMETPLGALEGRAPRVALEQGELAERILYLAASDGL